MKICSSGFLELLDKHTATRHTLQLLVVNARKGGIKGVMNVSVLVYTKLDRQAK